MVDNNEKKQLNQTIGDKRLQVVRGKEEEMELAYQGDTDWHFAEPGDCD